MQLLLRGSRLRNTKWIVGVVLYTGVETKARPARAGPARGTPLLPTARMHAITGARAIRHSPAHMQALPHARALTHALAHAQAHAQPGTGARALPLFECAEP